MKEINNAMQYLLVCKLCLHTMNSGCKSTVCDNCQAGQILAFKEEVGSFVEMFTDCDDLVFVCIYEDCGERFSLVAQCIEHVHKHDGSCVLEVML